MKCFLIKFSLPSRLRDILIVLEKVNVDCKCDLIFHFMKKSQQINHSKNSLNVISVKPFGHSKLPQ